MAFDVVFGMLVHFEFGSNLKGRGAVSHGRGNVTKVVSANSCEGFLVARHVGRI